MKTYSPKPRDIERRWYVVDAQGAVLGRLASEVAKVLRGKHKPIFAPHVDTGDHVIVVNAGGTVLTGGKEEKKIYYRHSLYPGGLREMTYARLLSERPTLAVEKAVKGMLPKNRLGRQMLRKLSVYQGPEHPHQAQKPVALGLGEVPPWEGLPVPAPSPAPAPKPKVKAKARPSKAGGAAKAGAAAPRGRASSARTKAPARKAAEPTKASARAKGSEGKDDEGTARRRIRRRKQEEG